MEPRRHQSAFTVSHHHIPVRTGITCGLGFLVQLQCPCGFIWWARLRRQRRWPADP